MTLEGFLKHFKDKYDLELSMVSCGVSIVYSMFSSKAKERMQVVEPLPHATTPPLDGGFGRVDPRTPPPLGVELFPCLCCACRIARAQTCARVAESGPCLC